MMTRSYIDAPNALALNTAYAYNTRPGARRGQRVKSGWHEKIDELLERDYAFLGYRYSKEGSLFRGISTGLAESLATDRWKPYGDNRPLCQLEQELGVYLLSHDLSDALSVARLWQNPHDAAVFVFPSACFNAQWEARRAAVLGFAEPGVVFKYPFLVDPLSLDEISTIVVAPAAVAGLDCPHKLMVLPELQSGDRSQTESAVIEVLRDRGITAATLVATDCFPRTGACPNEHAYYPLK